MSFSIVHVDAQYPENHHMHFTEYSGFLHTALVPFIVDKLPSLHRKPVIYNYGIPHFVGSVLQKESICCGIVLTCPEKATSLSSSFCMYYAVHKIIFLFYNILPFPFSFVGGFMLAKQL